MFGTASFRKMNGKVIYVRSILFLWCVFTSKAESPLVYLHTPYVQQHFFAQTGGISFGFSSSPYPATAFASSKVFAPRNAYMQPRIHPIPVTRYSLRTTGLEEEHHQEPSHYEFYYNVQDPNQGTEFGHQEYRDEHVAKGQYVVLLPDGRRQIVDYVADRHGYRPTIRYEGGYDKFRYR